MIDRARCDTCRHWTATGTVGSGIPTPDGTREWTYRVGVCAKGDALGASPAPPEWSSCHLHRARVAPPARTE
jgi:hypothetical protein